MVINGDEDSARHIREMLFWDVNNGIARRSWARNDGSMSSIEREMDAQRLVFFLRLVDAIENERRAVL